MTDQNDTSNGMGEGPLAVRFARHLASQGTIQPGDRLVVAVSGGVDSLALLHLLRFGPHLPGAHLIAAHFDHGIRPESGEDALWVRGLCRSWRVPFRLGRTKRHLGSEEQAREARYRFLLEVLKEDNGRWLLTGHHGDDQAETVLFRILRGTGLAGLAGIPALRPPGIYRPLLPFTRKEIVAYAVSNGLRYREDPSNEDQEFSRNFLRQRIIPLLEGGPTPRARVSLLRLARLARQNEDAWRSLLPSLLHGVLEQDGEAQFVVRSSLLAYHPAVQARLWREVLRRAGSGLDEAGTRALLEFTRTGPSGRVFSLAGGSAITREFDRFRVGMVADSEENSPLTLEGVGAGSGEVRVGGIRYQVVWGASEPVDCDEVLGIPPDSVRFPLRMRSWAPGDRIRLPYGTKKLKKLFSEAKVPVETRIRIPILVDSGGRIIWVPGVASSILIQAQEGPETFFLGIRNVG